MSVRTRTGAWRVLGTGAALPGAALTTAEVLDRVERVFSAPVARRGLKIAERIGVRTRHFCRDFAAVGEPPRAGDTNPELAARALQHALDSARLKVNDLGYVITHTTSPHTLLPANAAWMADHLGYAGPYAELRQACAGFAHAVQLGVGLLGAPGDAPIAIVGSETGSVFLDPRAAATDIGQLINLIQMGDGAGAVILAPDAPGAGARLSVPYVGSLGPGLAPGFWMDAGGSGAPAPRGVMSFHHDFAGVRSNGGELFRRAISVVRHAGIDIQAIQWFLPHQANAVDLPSELAAELGVPRGRMLVDCNRVGNLGSASIWVALHQARVSGTLADLDRVLVLGAEATKYLFGGFVYEHSVERL